jgi:hypothetical protein
MWQTEKVKGKNKLSSEWIDVDLGSSQDVSQVILEWDAYFATGYSIQVSNNGSSWSTVFSTSSGNGGNDTLSFNTVQARYIRLNSTGWSNNSYRNWLKELEVYAASGTASTSPTPTQTEPAAPTFTPTPTSTPDTSNSIHVGDLDASPASNGSRWNAIVNVTVHDTSEMPIQGVTVSGDWSNGANGSGSCTTNSSGTCSISRNNLKNSVGSVDFTVTNLSGAFSYLSSSNHDPDGDSNGSSMTVLKP